MLLGFILFLLTLAGCCLFLFNPVWFPLPISAEAVLYDHQFTWTLWITGIIFVATQLLLAWTVLRGRRRKQASRTRGSRTLELIWTSTTAVLFLALAMVGSRGWAKTSTGSAGKEVIHVEAHQFAWNFHFPGP